MEKNVDIPFVVGSLAELAFESTPIDADSNNRVQIVIAGSMPRAAEAALHCALVCHYPNYERDRTLRTRITLVTDADAMHRMLFDYAELFDNSWWRHVDLRGNVPEVKQHRPVYSGKRDDFVDVEWEFVTGTFEHPAMQRKLALRYADPTQELTVILCHEDNSRNEDCAARLQRRMPGLRVVAGLDRALDAAASERCLGMARYLNYFYEASYSLSRVPIELPEDEVERAWSKVSDVRLQLSNVYNVMSMATKMRTLGHSDATDSAFYALNAKEVEELTAVEHNRWSVERLIQGMRPCSDEERGEIEKDLSLKKKYKNERGAHYDLVSYGELGVDETGLPVSRYDRDLTASIPLIVQTYNQRHG